MPNASEDEKNREILIEIAKLRVQPDYTEAENPDADCGRGYDEPPLTERDKADTSNDDVRERDGSDR